MSHPIEAKNWVDRLVEFASPRRALERYAARASIDVARSMPSASYRGGISTRTSTPFDRSTSYKGGSIRDRQDLGTMRDRARTVFRENAIGRSLLNTETDNIVAEGFTLQMATMTPEFNKEAEDRFYKWLETADISGKASASDLFRMSWREPRKDGDGGFLLIKRGGYPKLQYIPGDLIRNPYKGYDFKTMFTGVECDPSGRAIRFWVRDVDQFGKDAYSPVDARDFIWIAHLDDPMAIRGGTVYGPIFDLLDQIDTYRDSVTKASILACLFGLIEKRRNPGDYIRQLGTELNSQGMQQKIISMEAGQLKVMGTDESVFQLQANQPMQQTPEFLRALSRIAAIGFDMPLEVALRDLSQVNFSGGQLGMKGYERTCRVRQDWLKSQCWNRLTFWWLSVEKQRQVLRFADAFKTPFPADYGSFELHAREWLLRDRLGEAQADLMEFAIGVSSPQRRCSERSVNFAEMLAEREIAWKATAKAGLPNVLPTATRDGVQKITAVDANGNPVGGNADEKAVEFKRSVVSAFLADHTTNDIIYNITDIPKIMTDVGLPIDRKVQSNPDQGVPLLPIIADNGQLVSGAVIYDPQGNVVGGDVENNADGAATVPAAGSVSTPPAQSVGNGNGGQQNQNDPSKDNAKP